MTVKNCKEWFLPVQWGKIALVSWGDTSKRPMLMVHGYMDSASTFIPLVETLPDTHYYVAFDMPGHGKSDPFPKGFLVTSAEQVEVVRRIVDSMKWQTFDLITHSVAFFVGVMYNCLHPGRVKRVVNLDPRPPLATYCFNQYNMPLWYQYVYLEFYDDHDSWHQELPKEYSYEEAISTLMRNRKLSREQAQLVLSRVLVPQSKGKYKLSWEARSKKLTAVPVSEDMLYRIVASQPPPSLNILAAEDDTIGMFQANSRRLLSRFQQDVPSFSVLEVQGPHDVHITNPGAFVEDVVQFLNKDFDKVTAKL